MFLSGPQDWGHKKSRKDGGVLLWFFPCTLLGGIVVPDFREHLNHHVKCRFPRFHPQDSHSVSLGARPETASWEATQVCHFWNPFLICGLFHLPQPVQRLLEGRTLGCLLLPFRKRVKCNLASPKLQLAHKSPASLWKGRFSLVQSGVGSKSMHFNSPWQWCKVATLSR